MGGGGDELSNAAFENDDNDDDDAETLDTPYTELEKRIAKSILPDNSVDVINSTVSEPPDPYPTGTKVQVYWADEAPAGNDPRLFAYLEMQTETRSLLGLLLWVSLAYPQISHCVNKACGFMSNPSHEVNAYAKHIALHLYQYPVAVKWGGATDLELSQPSPPPFTEGEKEMGLHFAADWLS